MNSDSSLAVSDFDEDTYEMLLENDQKANNYSGTSTFLNNNKQATSNILAHNSDDDSNNNYPNGSEQNHINFPSTSLRVIEASSTDEENIGNSQRLGKKRRRKPSLWKRNQAKTRKALGFVYTNTSGKVIDKRLPGTTCTCKNNCFSKISEDDRADIFNIFNDI